MVYYKYIYTDFSKTGNTTKRELLHAYVYIQTHAAPTWYGDLLRYRHGGGVLVSDSDSDEVGPWAKGYLRTAADGNGQVGNGEELLSCLPSAVK